MKREDVKTKHGEGIHFDTHVIANPANTNEWIILFKKEAGRSYFLVNDNEEIESFGHLDDLIADSTVLGHPAHDHLDTRSTLTWTPDPCPLGQAVGAQRRKFALLV